LRGHTVTAVEESRKGVRDAELNRRQNGVPEDRLKLVCASVEEALPRLTEGAFDAVVLDPRGAPARSRAVFARLNPPAASSSPATPAPRRGFLAAKPFRICRILYDGPSSPRPT
jgi:tRNA/tmRNA/rRNA uracil-C5-methylase (TrmA/RlmC/RlmD family)